MLKKISIFLYFNYVIQKNIKFINFFFQSSNYGIILDFNF